jgi:hypothetical protein
MKSIKRRKRNSIGNYFNQHTGGTRGIFISTFQSGKKREGALLKMGTRGALFGKDADGATGRKMVLIMSLLKYSADEHCWKIVLMTPRENGADVIYGKWSL